MTFEEMLERAQRMRSRDLYGKVSPEKLAKISFMETKIDLPINNNKTVHIYQITSPNRKINSPMIINFHGGGFIKGRQDKDQVFCSKLADTFSCLIWDIDYSLAPEAPYPNAVNESYAIVSYAFEHALELGIDATKIILMGHSAGGNLATTVCMKASETKAFKPSALVIEFCPLDLYTDPETKTRVEGDMPAEVAKTYNAFYCPPELANSPYVSPIFASNEQLSSFPDTLIISAGLDSLCFEDEEFAMKLSRAGITVTSRRFLNSHHGFTINRADEWEEATDLIITFTKQHLI